ncbi:hypothetical protein [Variovorax sp.]|jgi:hypothetical protein|uniref:hypothetical protein n=1 Tax=Variovorax sp. TaxID=1871043 RepID=UPI0037DA17F3
MTVNRIDPRPLSLLRIFRSSAPRLALVALAAGTLLAGCVTPGEHAREQRMRDEQNCMAYGFRPESPAYARCLQNENLSRQDRDNLQDIESRRRSEDPRRYGGGGGGWERERDRDRDRYDRMNDNQRQALRNCDLLPPANQPGCRAMVWSTLK